MVTIDFLNVGKGSCTVIDLPSGHLSMIDIYDLGTQDPDNGLQDPVQFLLGKYPRQSLFRYIQTHPDMDHMSGLNRLALKVPLQHFWDTDNCKSFSDADWEGSPYRKEDWECYQTCRASTTDPTALQLYRLQTSDCCWCQDGITILSPSPALVDLSRTAPDTDSQKFNHLSYVLMLEHAGVRVLLPGDASKQTWDDILADVQIPASNLKADILLAPHHGSENNVHEEAMETIAPNDIVVSVGEGVDYDYNYYKSLATRWLLTTKHHGNIHLVIHDDGTYSLTVQKNGARQTVQTCGGV